MNNIIDSHIHLDWYEESEKELILNDLEKYKVEALISVSENLHSAEMNLKLANQDSRIKPAFGYHPEQALPSDEEVSGLHAFIKLHHKRMVAVGEVGLPYYLRKDHPEIPLEPYVKVLELFIKLAQTYDKPIVLHAVYEDAEIACNLLEEYSIQKAHFHWFKGNEQTINRMINNQYFISITPDVLYEREIQELVKVYPLSLMMVETDGPWPFEGIFRNVRTNPKMIHQVVREIAQLKMQDIEYTYRILYENTKRFYQL